MAPSGLPVARAQAPTGRRHECKELLTRCDRTQNGACTGRLHSDGRPSGTGSEFTIDKRGSVDYRSDAFFDVLRGLLSLGRAQKRAIVITIDLLLCCGSAVAAFGLRLGEWNGFNKDVLTYMGVALAVWFPVFQLHGVYRAIFRFAGSRTIIALGYAAGVMAVPLAIIFMIVSVPGIPRTIAIIHMLLFVALLCLSRMTSRYLLVDLLAHQSFRGEQKAVLIYGAGASGRQLASSMQGEPSMALCGFIDDDERLDGQRLDGHPIYHSSRLSEVIERDEVKTVLLAVPRLGRSQRKEIVQRLEQYSVHVQTLPNVQQMVDGQISISDLREIQIEDLLCRDAVEPNQLLLGRTIVGKTVLVTGAGGSIGSELCRQIITMAPKTLVLVERSEFALYAINEELRERQEAAQLHANIRTELCDVGDAGAVERLLQMLRPDTVFHAAAYKHVPLVEANPVAGLRNNVFGTLNLAQAAQRAGVDRFILISTDKAVRPTNVMGASKRIAELILQALADTNPGTRFAMVRFGNVLGSSGSVVPRFQRQILNGGPVTITHRDVTRYFMTIPEAAQLVIQAGAMALGGEVYVLDMGESVKIIDLAKSMVRLSGLTIKSDSNGNGDIEIREVGLRPGEKLYEELLIGDNPEPTRHERIMRARETFIPWSRLSPDLSLLASSLDCGDTQQAIELVRILVPEFSAEPTGEALARPVRTG